jgi:lysozyme
MERARGIDVSTYQDNVDWKAVAEGGYSFAFCRISDGIRHLDGWAGANWQGIRRAGMVRGAYQYFRPSVDPVAQADLVIEALGELEPGDLPPAIDVETGGDLGPLVIGNAILAWRKRIESHFGVEPIVYTGPWFWNTFVGSRKFGDCALWVADYNLNAPRLPVGWTDWNFWQQTDKAVVPGVKTPCDAGVFNGSIEALRAYAERRC